MTNSSAAAEAVAALLASYRPTHISRSDWRTVRSEVLQAARAYEASESATRKILGHLAPFAAWARDEGATHLLDAGADAKAVDGDGTPAWEFHTGAARKLIKEKAGAT